MKIKFRPMKSHIKNSTSNGYSRSKKHNHNKINITINSVDKSSTIPSRRRKCCYDTECNSNNLEYDFKRDQLCCRDCGLVLREGFRDYKDLVTNKPSEEVLVAVVFSSDYNKKYLLDLIEIQEYKNRIDLVNYSINK